MRCEACGHAQLRDTVDPSYLYQETYTHRSSASAISAGGNDFLLSFLNDITQDRNFDCIAEIGCNDLYLLKKLGARSPHLVGFDPIWKDQPYAGSAAIQVHGKYIEEIQPRKDLPCPPDLILSIHTLEHVDNPLDSLRPIFDYAKPGALFVIEVPSFDTLLTIGRFDQIFHQHLNYFSLSSIFEMIHKLGGEYVSHRFNYGYWLGTMMVAFKKPISPSASAVACPLPPTPVSEILANFGDYQENMSNLLGTIQRFQKRKIPLIGFGAAQMIPTFAYHLRSDLGFLESILDDNPNKQGLTYPSIACEIASTKSVSSLAEHAVLPTALDSMRLISARAASMNARYILCPSNPY
jgi:cyclopropane-fatty-acyl-phospholipid synthase